MPIFFALPPLAAFFVLFMLGHQPPLGFWQVTDLEQQKSPRDPSFQHSVGVGSSLVRWKIFTTSGVNGGWQILLTVVAMQSCRWCQLADSYARCHERWALFSGGI